MAKQSQSTRGDEYPEVVQPMASIHNVYDSSYEYFLPQTSPAPEYVPQRSPAPEYQQYSRSPQLSSSASPRMSAASPAFGASGMTHSPSLSDSGWKGNSNTLSTQYSEYEPQPEIVRKEPQVTYVPAEKEYYNKVEVTPDEQGAFKIVRKPLPAQPTERKKRPIYKRPLWIIAGVVLVIIIAVAAACGVLFSKKKSTSGSPTPDNTTKITGDPDVAVGGYLSPSYYSKTGAWNGTGIAIAAAAPGIDQTMYVFYQDYTGQITWKLKETDGSFSQGLGTINSKYSVPMNGTPLSVVNHYFSNVSSVYHFFYIDSNFLIVERILNTSPLAGGSGGSVVPTWTDGPLTAKKLKTMQADTIGLQACMWNNYDGPYQTNDKYATSAIQLWYASSETQFSQYSWSNGTTSWNFDQTWDGLDGHAGVGCQTWDSWATEYVFFVDTNQKIAMYWKDNNRTAVSTAAHPTLKWNKIQNVNIDNVHKSSSLGYTNYMIYQDSSNAIRGANITWKAENTTVATFAASGQPDVFTIQDLNSDNAISAVRGTHISITALKTSSGGAIMQALFQQNGNDISVYTRDQAQVGGKWQPGAPVVSSS